MYTALASSNFFLNDTYKNKLLQLNLDACFQPGVRTKAEKMVVTQDGNFSLVLSDSKEIEIPKHNIIGLPKELPLASYSNFLKLSSCQIKQLSDDEYKVIFSARLLGGGKSQKVPKEIAEAIKRDDANLLAKWLEQGNSPDSQLTAKSSNIEGVSRYKIVNAPLIYFAIYRNSLECLCVLLKKGADINYKATRIKILSNMKEAARIGAAIIFLPLTMCFGLELPVIKRVRTSPLHEAIRVGASQNIIDLLLANNADFSWQMYRKMSLNLIGTECCVDSPIERQFYGDVVSNPTRRNAINFAIDCGNLKAITSLLNNGVDVGFKNTEEVDKWLSKGKIKSNRAEIEKLLKAAVMGKIKPLPQASNNNDSPEPRTEIRNTTPSNSTQNQRDELLRTPKRNGIYAVETPLEPKLPKEQSNSFAFSLIPYKALAFTDKTLGEGGFGVVKEASWQHTKVAVKQLKATHLSETSLQEFQQEAEQHGKLRHPNVVTLYGVCLEPSKYCMVMELMLGASLYTVLHNGQPLPWTLRLSIAQDIAAGLAFLHDQKILHRDLKSMNVLLDSNMRAKISDFGLSKVKTETSTTTTMQSSVGTLAWMAPELLQFKPKYSEASDIYALSIVFWELSSRALPYEGVNPQVIQTEIREGQREDIPDETPASFARLISQCWTQRAEERLKAKAVIEQLLSTDIGNLQLTAAAQSSGYQHFSH